MKSLDTKRKFIELRAMDESFNSISQKLNVSKPTLIKWSREMASELALAKDFELDSIQKQYQVSKRHRITVLGRRLQKVREELDARNMSNISTERLLELEERLTALLCHEETRLVFYGEEEEMKIEPLTHTPSWSA